MRFRLLGPLEVVDGERQVPIASGKQCALLAILLLQANRVVPMSRLVDDLWGDELPDTAVKSVQVYVSKLRKALPEPRLRTRGSGYLADVHVGELDLDTFSSLASAGRAALGDDAARAVDLLTEALALWRGPALVGLDAPFVPAEAARLEELQLACREDRMEALLVLGRQHELVPELEVTTARHPLRERSRTLLMLALYRAGRQADALAAYSSFRELLHGALGIEPTPELRELERRILNQDPALDAPAPPAVTAGPGRTAPRGTGPPRSAERDTGPERLLEREQALEELDGALARANAGSGRVVLVTGEAGVGKTALVEDWAQKSGSTARVLTGACDSLLTPRALGPIRDIAHQAGGRLADAIAQNADRDVALDALLAELSEGRTILVVEDAHWADEATLDVLAVLGRRISRLPAVLVATTRPEGLATGHGLLGAVGELPPGTLVRVDLEPLSSASVEELAREAGRPADGLQDATGGNPFYVTEVLAAGGSAVPASVRAAVLARCGRLSPVARPVIDVVSVVPGRAELDLVVRVLGPQTAAIEEALVTGILTSDGTSLRFRHEIARLVVESELSPPRRAELERTVLAALEGLGADDLARAVHHARLAGDDDAVRRLAPAAAREAAAAGAHREAADHYRTALSVAHDLPAEARVELLESFSIEAYLADSVSDALEARREALGLRMKLGDRVRVGDGLRWLARLLWWSGEGDAARDAAVEAIDVLEPAGPTRELAMALSSLSQLDMLAWRPAEAIALAERARTLARSLGDEETVVHALTNIGIARRLEGNSAAGRETLIDAFTRGSTAGFHDHAGRALAGLASTAMELRDATLVDEDLELGIRYLDSHNLDGYRRYVVGIRAMWRVERGDPDGAEEDAVESLRGGKGAGISGLPGLLALARVQARRGDPAASATLDAALRLARSSQELQRVGPATAALAEHAWLAGDLDAVVNQVDEVYRAALDVTAVWLVGELAFWLWHAGRIDRAPDVAPAPYRLLMEGRWREAAAAWDALGMPYQQAVALAHGDTPEALEEALRLFERVGAPAAAARLRRERGVVADGSVPRRDPR
jgi:DNA-binding SARP family transcriptional activator/tetratricopeptide (TPR) repeat protein